MRARGPARLSGLAWLAACSTSDPSPAPAPAAPTPVAPSGAELAGEADDVIEVEATTLPIGQGEWPEGVPTPAKIYWVTAARSELDPTRFGAKAPLGEAWPRWAEALRTDGKLVSADENASGVRAEYCPDADCSARYTIVLDAWGETEVRGVIQPLLTRAPIDLPGKCVTPRDTRFSFIEHRSGHGFDDYLQQQIDIEQDYRWSFEPIAGPDLDLDGQLDLMVPIDEGPKDRSCQEDIRWQLYVMRGDCGVFVGEIEGRPGDERRGPPLSMEGGLVRLFSIRSGGGPERGDTHLVYTFDGQRYVEASREVQGARCDVHPADCDPLVRSSCRRE